MTTSKQPTSNNSKPFVGKMLITGHKGFIGNSLYQFMMSDVVYGKWQIDTIDFPDDISDIKPEIKYDVVVHLAAFAAIRESIEDPEKYWENNVEKAKPLFEYCRQNDVRLLYASSAAAAEWWQNPYGMTKKANELMAPYNSVGMRFMTVYQEGYTSREDMLFRKLEDRKAAYLTNHKRDWINVMDVNRAIAYLIPSSVVGTIDIGTGDTYSVLELAEAFKQGNLPIREDTPGEADVTCADTTKLKSIGWYPTYDVIDTVRSYLPYEQRRKPLKPGESRSGDRVTSLPYTERGANNEHQEALLAQLKAEEEDLEERRRLFDELMEDTTRVADENTLKNLLPVYENYLNETGGEIDYDDWLKENPLRKKRE